MTEQEQQILQNYQQEASTLTQQVLAGKRSINQISLYRLAAFLTGIVIIYLIGHFGAIYMLLVFLLTSFVFMQLVMKQGKLQIQHDFNKNLLAVIENEINNLQAHQNSYDDGSNFTDAAHPYTDDLDIFGPFSLFHEVNRSNTQNGKAILADWFKNPVDKIKIEERQQAVKELTQKIKATFNFRAHLLPFVHHEMENLSAAISNGLKNRIAFTDRKWLKTYIQILPYLITALIAGAFFTSIFLDILGFVLLFNFFLSGIFNKEVNSVHSGFSKCAGQLNSYAEVLKWVEEENWQSAYLKKLVQQCESANRSEKTYVKIASLAKIIKQFDLMTTPIGALFLNLLFLWGIRCSINVSRWHQTSSVFILKAFEVISGFEAITSLSTLHYNHPDWPFPKISNEFGLKMEQLGHPLIAEEKRVVNNFSMENHKTVDVITGSNMAGKSTFLRTLGINLVLAYSGAPVCAESMAVSVLKLVSYMRIKDSLNESTSTFKAELDRLKMILEKTAAETDVLVLIDEMLRGTNSKDKYAGSKAFIERLIRQQTAALVATHDLQIADLADEHPGAVRNFHFDIKMQNQDMFFDYKIKDGACKTFNASILLREIGLEVG